MSEAGGDDFQSLRGRLAWEPETVEVRESDIRRYMEAVGYGVEERDPGTGALLAPPLFLPPFHHGGVIDEDGRRRRPGEIELPAGERGRLLKGCRAEFHRPVRAGDIVTATTRVVEVSSERRDGRPRFTIVTETAYTDQDGGAIRTERWTVVRL